MQNLTWTCLLHSMDDSPTLSEIYLGHKPLGRRSEHPLSALFEVDDQRLPHVTMVVEHYSEEEAGDGIRGHELAYILLAMQVRYSQPEFSEYKTIPVSSLSLLFHYTETNLSRFYFCPS
jgi:hypothetical protein